MTLQHIQAYFWTFKTDRPKRRENSKKQNLKIYESDHQTNLFHFLHSFVISSTKARQWHQLQLQQPAMCAGATATKKKRASKELPDGLAELNESNFRRSMEFRLETDLHEQSEVMVAFRARKPDSPAAL
jgi:hypothetical protein